MLHLLDGYKPFVETTTAGLESLGIERRELAMLDHLCYRVETLERYHHVLSKLGNNALILGETIIGGRPITTAELNTPLEAASWRIPYIEIPAPKHGSYYPEGLEHAEFVVIGGLEVFRDRHPDIPFDSKGMHKKLNPELGLKQDQLSVKFHEAPLGAIVRIEQSLGLD